MILFRNVMTMILSALALSAIYGTSAQAQTVSVKNGEGENGFGWMFGQAGTCYAVMPRHVAGIFPRVTISTAAPVQTGTGTVIAPFWEGIDLAIAVVRGIEEDRCTERLDTLNIDSAGRRAAEASLLRLSPSGEEERVPLHIMRRDYLTLEARIEGGREIMQGTSGAFAFVGETPIGMAYASADPGQATFMRSEEILINLRRFLNEQGAAYAAPSAAVTLQPADPSARGGLQLVVANSSTPPINPRFAPENLAGDGVFVYDGVPGARIVFGFATGDVAAVQRLRITAPTTAGYALPRTIIVQYSLDAEGRRFREWTRGQMAPDGLFDTGQMAPRNMRWVALTILDAWSTGPVVIDEVIVD
ncbi:MAG: hypothetical protein CMO30_21460 [Tistrella sp.]|uniref:Uncharacterized protein n=1 Tax=Tistrella mobilis TaxID=171437 RepID=A0A3B9IDS8_9PROT|nr:hypothetical protein [Tistrella sp.]MAD37189.1 hypothetical protein [Tistrella sp.]MBA77845.1 hypothetical protein [Tistrella sp.]HAE46041.1 hypothetical protein [Tistrella mobilis]|tara:strand:- start:975 stop:2054 length:1080 start_codon:yes stop_codon:yes gene_type:complete